MTRTSEPYMIRLEKRVSKAEGVGLPVPAVVSLVSLALQASQGEVEPRLPLRLVRGVGALHSEGVLGQVVLHQAMHKQYLSK